MNNHDNPEVVGRDLAGYPYNKKYPGMDTSKDNLYHGYPDSFRETLFYDFAVLGYDLMFVYKGQTYYVLNDGEAGVWLSDSNFTTKRAGFANGNDFIENFKIDGKNLIDIIDSLEDVQPV